jgi:hypothetical protein
MKTILKMMLIVPMVIGMLFSCSTEQTEKSEASFFQTADAKGKPVAQTIFTGGTATNDIIIDGSGFKLRFENFSDVTFDNNAYMHFTNYYYMRRETTKSDVGNYRFLEETSDRDWLATVSNAGTGRGTRLFLDGNVGSSNFEITSDEGSYKKINGNNNWLNLDGLKTFETKEEAKLNRVYGLFKNSQGVIMTTD